MWQPVGNSSKRVINDAAHNDDLEYFGVLVQCGIVLEPESKENPRSCVCNRAVAKKEKERRKSRIKRRNVEKNVNTHVANCTYEES
jgi:hypothetical protein